MNPNPARPGRPTERGFLVLVFLAIVLAPLMIAPQHAYAAASASDNFARASGSLGSNWTGIQDGGLAISSDAVVGTTSQNSGDMWTADSFSSDQFSQVELTSTQLSGSQWVGAAVRMQNNGLTGYVGIYFWNFGNPELMLFRRQNGGWTEIGGTYASGALPAGTLLELTAVGSSLSFTLNGVQQLGTTDSVLTGGAPGIVMNQAAQAAAWAGGDASASGGGAPTTYSVGGTVSGVSGTLTLQDNGGDNLSVSANGAFTFATALASGAAYNVTVASAPAGQTCQVSNGSGTVAAANITNVAVTCAASGAATSASDNFARANGSLGPNWTDIQDGGLAISSNAVVGTTSQNSGDMYTADSFSSDQFSQVGLTATQLSGSQWVGAAVRMQNNGLTGYVGIYFWNSGNPELMLFRRQNGGWTEIAGTYASGALPAGTLLELTAVGSSLSFTLNGVQRIGVSDSALTGGAPGIMMNQTARAASWAGGDASDAGDYSGGGAAATYSVGGMVSGLSGTLTLADNGGDNLSVSANGAFTFATALASGAAYNVTVATSPTGQTCQVSNGSGTVAAANITNVAVSCSSSGGATSASDSFARANGSLGPNWTDIQDGGLAISSGAVVGTTSQNSGDMWTANAFSSDQFSQVTLTATQLSGSQWVGAAVRMQSNGLTGYVGLYFWNSGNPELMLFRRQGGGWAQIGSTYASGALPAGTQLELTAVGNSLSFTENGVQRIGVSDSALTGGAPGIIMNQAAQAASWTGGNAGFRISYQSTSSSGVASYDVISPDNGYGPQVLRVLQPMDPAPGVPHNFIIALPVQPGLNDTYGDGLDTLQSLNAQNQYNLTVIEPTFGVDPWYADNPNDPSVQYESFLTQELVPWIRQNLSTTDSEQIWLLGFSKSGYGAQDLLLKHPDLFSLAASWDSPMDMSSYSQYGDSVYSYGTEANFQANYQLTTAFIQAHAAPFESSNRIWIGGYSLYQTDMSDYDALLASDGVQHTTGTSQQLAHNWTSGWVPAALAGLATESANLPAAP